VIDLTEESVLASRNVELYQDEVDYLITSTPNKTAHKKVLSFGLVEYIVTSVQGQSFYCRSINTADTGGLCIIVTPKVVFAASYKNTHSPQSVAPQTIPYIIDQVQHFDKM